MKYQLRTLHENGQVDYTDLPGKPNLATMQNNKPPQQHSEEMLLPAGYSIQSNGEIETPLERQQRLMAKRKNENKNSHVEDDDLLLPVGVTLEG